MTQRWKKSFANFFRSKTLCSFIWNTQNSHLGGIWSNWGFRLKNAQKGHLFVCTKSGIWWLYPQNFALWHKFIPFSYWIWDSVWFNQFLNFFSIAFGISGVGSKNQNIFTEFRYVTFFIIVFCHELISFCKVSKKSQTINFNNSRTSIHGKIR